MGRCMRLDCQRGDISIRTAHRKNGSARELFCVHVAKRRKILPASNGLANFPLNTEFWANAKQREIFGANTTRCGPPAGELGGRPCHERHGAWSGGNRCGALSSERGGSVSDGLWEQRGGRFCSHVSDHKLLEFVRCFVGNTNAHATAAGMQPSHKIVRIGRPSGPRFSSRCRPLRHSTRHAYAGRASLR